MRARAVSSGRHRCLDARRPYEGHRPVSTSQASAIDALGWSSKEVQSFLDGNRAARSSLARIEGEYLDVGETSLRRTAVTGQDYEMRPTNPLGGLCGSHKCALIGGCAVSK